MNPETFQRGLNRGNRPNVIVSFRTSELDRARSKFRIYLNTFFMLLVIVAASGAVYAGKKGISEGDNVHNRNMQLKSDLVKGENK